MTLLETIQETIPTATQSQVSDILQAQGTTESAVLAKPGKLAAFTQLVGKAQPGAIATNRSEVLSTFTSIGETPALKVPDAAPIVPAASVTGDRDWTKFDVRNLSSLTTPELREFKAFREAELERKNLLNEILGLEAENIDVEAANLQAQTQTQTASRMVESDRAAFEVSAESGDDLIKLAREAGRSQVLDQVARDRAALEATIAVGKQTPTQGEIGLAQAQGLRRRRMNALVGTQNQLVPEVRAIASAQTEKEMVTIDA